MKRLLIIGLVAFFALTSSFAQKNATPEQKAHNRVERLDKSLSLSAEQKEQLTTLFKKGDKEQKGEIKKILTEDQFEKYEAIQQAKKTNPKKSGDSEKAGKKEGSENKGGNKKN